MTTDAPELTVGAQAPDFVYTDARGKTRRLADAWAARPALVVWLRRFDLPFQAEILGQLRERRDALAALGVEPVCVVQGSPGTAAGYCAAHGMADACVGDRHRQTYRAMGFGQAPWKEVLVPADPDGLLAKLRRVLDRRADVRQLPGAAIVAAGGEILWLHRGRHVADLPSVGELLRVATAHLDRAAAAHD